MEIQRASHGSTKHTNLESETRAFVKGLTRPLRVYREKNDDGEERGRGLSSDSNFFMGPYNFEDDLKPVQKNEATEILGPTWTSWIVMAKSNKPLTTVHIFQMVWIQTKSF
ncbi:Deacetoxyvindoline 4-hydroxylase [Senna tora]|uniref:Deacetoxyvindoline 4-hydroxylase n=2 Tax=Senna tora TaxID=362788 RepID=A0A834X3X7_9FABA|nr:Deacetoxyvindoline 4-hydroxylase [Senna tora]